jgi:tetratricopeptide (TPR) repeat protein
MTWDEPDALAMAEKLPDIKERTEVLHLNKQAREAISEENVQLCIKLLERALSLDPNNLNVLMRLATFYEERNEFEKELEMRRRMADLEFTHAAYYYRRLAEWEMQRGNRKTAQEIARKAVDSYDVLEEARGYLLAEDIHDRAFCYHLLGENKKAEEELRAGVAQYPNAALLYFALGAVCHNTNRPDEAQAMYETALAHDPDHQEAKVMLGQLLAIKGETERAVALLQQVLAVEPGNRKAQMVLERYGGTQ